MVLIFLHLHWTDPIGVDVAIYITFLDTGITNFSIFISENSGVSILSSFSIFLMQSQKVLESKVGVRGSGKERMALLDKEDYRTKAFGSLVSFLSSPCVTVPN